MLESLEECETVWQEKRRWGAGWGGGGGCGRGGTRVCSLAQHTRSCLQESVCVCVCVANSTRTHALFLNTSHLPLPPHHHHHILTPPCTVLYPPASLSSIRQQSRVRRLHFFFFTFEKYCEILPLFLSVPLIGPRRRRPRLQPRSRCCLRRRGKFFCFFFM